MADQTCTRLLNLKMNSIKLSKMKDKAETNIAQKNQ